MPSRTSSKGSLPTTSRDSRHQRAIGLGRGSGGCRDPASVCRPSRRAERRSQDIGPILYDLTLPTPPLRPVPLGITHVPICVPVLSWLRSSQATSARGRRATSRLLPQNAVGAGALAPVPNRHLGTGDSQERVDDVETDAPHVNRNGVRSRGPPSARRVDLRSANPNIATLPPSYRRVGVAKIETMLQEIFGDPVRSKEIGELAPALTSLLTAPCVTDCSWSGSDT